MPSWYFRGGLIGTGHHWYFTGQTNFNMALSALFSALEVVPLTLLTLDAWDFVRTTRGDREVCGKSVAIPHKWTFWFLMAVGFWNFVGAGMFGFLINLPIVSYYEVGTILTVNHGHAAMMGVFGMLAIALMVFVLRQTSDEARWPAIEKYVKVGFFGTNIGLAMMVAFSLFPGGVLQVWDVIQNGYWHARSLAYTGSDTARLLEWLRTAGRSGLHLSASVPAADGRHAVLLRHQKEAIPQLERSRSPSQPLKETLNVAKTPATHSTTQPRRAAMSAGILAREWT